MHHLNLDEGKIKIGGEWCSGESLSRRIQEKIKTGDYRFADLAAALERLNIALENSRRLEVNVVISKEEYEELKAIGGMDDRECIRKAIMAFIGYEVGMDRGVKKQGIGPKNDSRNGNSEIKPQVPVLPPILEKKTKNKTTVRCFKCKSPMEISSHGDTNEISCPNCDKATEEAGSMDNGIRYKDHFLG